MQHDDLVEHVIRVHVEVAEPIRIKDIKLIRQVEEGALEGSLEYPGQLLRYSVLSMLTANS